jgi:hypothetical protein
MTGRKRSQLVALFATITFGLLFCVRPSSAQTSCPPQGTTQGWPLGSPVYYSISSSFSSTESGAITQAFNNWNGAPTDLGIFFAPASGSNPAMITVQPGSASGRPAMTTYGAFITHGTCTAIINTASTTIDINNVGVPSGGTAFFNKTQSNYALAITKVMQHELGHTMGLGDEPTISDPFGCGGQTAGLTVMNGECETNDSANNDPNAPTSCDVNSIQNNPQLSANGGCGPPPPCPQSCTPNYDINDTSTAVDYCTYPATGCPSGYYDKNNDGCCGYDNTSPILIDTSGHGFYLTDARGGVLFDIAGTGHPKQMGWTATGANNAFLALPGADGLVHSGKQLFGNFTPQPKSANPNGFAALAVYDDPKNGGNGDGVIDSKDEIFSLLRLWIDANHDGICQPEELHTLPSLGVTSISLTYRADKKTDQYGNVFRYRAQVDPGDPTNTGRMAYDVFFVSLPPDVAKNLIPWRVPPAAIVQKCPLPVQTKGGMLSTPSTLR